MGMKTITVCPLVSQIRWELRGYLSDRKKMYTGKDMGKLTEQTLKWQVSPRWDNVYVCLKRRGKETAKRKQLEQQLKKKNQTQLALLGITRNLFVNTDSNEFAQVSCPKQ